MNMSDEHEIPVKVVDRRWWAKGESQGAATGEQPSLKPTYVEQLERQVAEKDQQIQEYIAKYRKAAQEFEDARLRLRREISKDLERGRREILADLLEVVDNLDRAIESARQSPSPDSSSTGSGHALLQGVEMVRRQFLAKLESFGVKRIDVEDQRFDPEVHEAIATVPAPTPDRDGVVVGVVRHGYRIGDDVLRPAAVAVAKSEA